MRTLIILLILGVFPFVSSAQTPVVMANQSSNTYSENFSDIGNWTNNFATGLGASAWGSVAVNATGSIGDGVKTTISTATFSSSSSGGVQKGTGTIVMLSTSTANACAIDFYVNFSGVNAGTISFDLSTIFNSTGDRDSKLKLFYTLDGVTFTEITGTNLPYSARNNVASSASISVNLPAALNNASGARLRFYEYSTSTGGTPSGSQPKISIDNLVITATANNTPCTTPSNQPTGINITNVSSNGASATFNTAVPSANNYLILLSNNQTLTSSPVNGTSYVAGDNIDDATVIAVTNSTSFSLSLLSPSTTYWVFVFALNNMCTGGPLYLLTNPLSTTFTTTSGILPCSTPTSQPSSLVFPTIAASGIQAVFNASPNADEYLVVRSSVAQLSRNPVNTQSYSFGDTLGGGIVISTGSDTSFIDDSLSASTTYYYTIFAVNAQDCSNGPVYSTSNPLKGSVTTASLGGPCVAPTTQPSSLNLSATNNNISGSFSAATGADSYLVLYSTSSSLTQLPVNNTNYSPGATLGNATVVSNSLSLSFYQNSLSSSTRYYFYVFAENSTCTGGTKYNTTSPLTQNITTTASSAYNYYYGNLHAHSGYSDGNKDNPTYTPANDYAYAKNSLHMDFLGISEHNHSGAGMNMSSWPLGVAQAQAATTSSFVALYGQEWGVISGGGHVLIYGIDSLIGWEPGNYQIYVAKSDYTGPDGLFKRLNKNGNAFASYAHPTSSDYNSVSSSAFASFVDSCVIGCAVESGPAFATNTTYDSFPSSMSFLSYYNTMLGKGYHIGPFMDHDSHYTNFGRANEIRTVVLAPSLTKANLIDAFKARHFYATEDFDTKISFTLNNEIMGSVLSGNTSPSISVSVTDPTAPTGATRTIKLMYGVPGSGKSATQLTSSSTGTLTYTHTALATGSSAYYYLDITINGRRSVTAPIWYTKTNAVATPTITAGSLTGFGKQLQNTTSAEKTFTVSGTALTGNVTITAPAGFQISSTSGSGFATTLTLTPSSGTLTSRTIYVRFNPTGLKIYSGNIACSATGATTQNVAVSGTAYITATACNSYTWNGTTYTTSGDKTYTTTGSGGVDSTATLQLTINYSTSSTQSASACSSYTWKGVTYTTSGAKTWTGTNAAGCDSVVTLNLTIFNGVSSTTNVTTCNSSYTWNGQTYTSSGTYNYTTQNYIGCDSTATLNLTLKKSSTSISSATACSSYSWNGQTYTSSGTYTYSTLNAIGCDSTATLNLTINALPDANVTNANNQICSGSTASFNINGTSGAIVSYNINGGPSANITLTNGTANVSVSNATINQTINLTSVTNPATNCSKSISSTATVTVRVNSSNATWNFNTASPSQATDITVGDLSQGNSNGTVSLLNSNVQSSGYTGASGGNNANLIARTGLLNTANNGSGYFSFNVTAPNNGTFNLNGISFGSYSTASGPQSYVIRSSSDNYLTNIDSGSLSNNSTWSLKSKTGINLSGTNTTFRIYGFNGAGDTSTTTPTASKIAGWNFFGQTSPPKSAATIFNANLDLGGSDSLNNITRGDSALSSSASNSFRTTGFKNNGISTSNKDYFQITLKPLSGYNMSLSTINARLAGTSSFNAAPGVTSQFAYSLDNINFTLIGSPSTSTSSKLTVDLSSVAALQNVSGGTTVYIRYYASGQTSTGGWGFTSANASDTSNGLEFLGTVSSSTVATSNWRIDDLNLNFTNNNSAASSSVNVSTCGAYIWNGNTYTTSGTYTWNGTSASGCDSIATLNLTIKQSTSSSSTVSACGSYIWNGTTYTTSGTRTWTGTNAAGCDSTATLNLTIKQANSSVTNASACGSYTWNGTTYTTSGTKTWTGINATGCDSTATLNLTIKQASSSNTTVSACGSYTWNGTTYTTSGVKTWTGINAAGCDSTATLNLTIKQASSSNTTVSACGSYTWNGTTYTTSGAKTWTGTNAAGCDSIATLNLTIKQPTTSSSTIAACGSYTWNGTIYTTSGPKTWTGTNAVGCDSTATLNLTIKQPTTSTTNISNCVSYTWNGTTYTTSGTKTWTGTNVAGCDSIATLNLTIKQASSSNTTVSACGSYTWNGTTYTTSGAKTWTGTNAAGCDSTATLNLTIKQPTTSTTNISNCVSYTWNGTTYTTSGTKTWTGTNAAGCDSTATLNLTIKQPSSSSSTISACGSYTWNGTTYTTSGTKTWTGTNAVGCDSTATLNLTIKQSTSSTENVTIFSNQIPFVWNGNDYSVSGVYRDTLVNQEGCDSTMTLNLSVVNYNLLTTLNIKIFLEGYYLSAGIMKSTLYDLGISSNNNETDSIYVELWRQNRLNADTPDYKRKVVLHSDGTATMTFPALSYGNYYYLVVKHRNSIETWSRNPVYFLENNNYDFTTSQVKAFQDGINPPMRQVEVGKYAFYGGDVNHDGTIDINDLQQTENDAFNFSYGYFESDCTGDGATDALDMQNIENNVSKMIFFARP